MLSQAAYRGATHGSIRVWLCVAVCGCVWLWLWLCSRRKVLRLASESRDLREDRTMMHRQVAILEHSVKELKAKLNDPRRFHGSTYESTASGSAGAHEMQQHDSRPTPVCLCGRTPMAS